jgi:hypothetical protein
MIITKMIQTKVHIDDPMVLYTRDIESVIMDILKQRLEGYCYMSCCIIEVVEIQQRSNFTFSKQRQDGSASCNVRIKVRGIVIKKHEMLHDCVVKKIDKDGHIICKNKHAAVYIRASDALQTIKQGQTIVALAGQVKYSLFKSAISVNALPFIPIVDDKSDVIYKIVVENTTGIIQKMLAKLKKEIEDNNTLDSEIYSFFTDLIYPYKSKKKYKDSVAQTKTLESVANAPDGTKLILSQPDWLPLDKPNILVYENLETDDILNNNELQAVNNGIVITENYEGVVGYMIHKYIEHILTIRQLCTSYNTMKLVNENNNIWDIYKRNRH